MDFFKRIIELQKPFARRKTITNSLQTNGTLLTDKWCALLKKHGFLVGISLDGPQEIHNRYRFDRKGKGSFDRVVRGLKLLQKHQVEYNVLVCVARETAKRPLDVYRFLRSEGVEFIQFTPIVERMAGAESGGPSLRLCGPALWLWVLGAGQAVAGGLLLYEVGTPDVGLASAGWGARAQDASTVLTNPAGMTRLEGSQVLLGAQALYGDYGFSIGPGTSSGLGTGDGGNPIGWLPGSGAFMSFSASPDLKFGFAMAGNFGLSEKYDDNWVGRYPVQEATLLGMSLLPSIAYKVNDKLGAI
jgi:hypothetical protein